MCVHVRVRAPSTSVLALNQVSLLPAPCHRGIMHAQAGDRGLSEEVQRPEEAEGNLHVLQAGFVPPGGMDRVVSLGQRYEGDGHVGILVVKKGQEMERAGGCI